MGKVKVNPDLENERKKCSFNVEELTTYFDGNAENTKIRRDFENELLNIRELWNGVPEEYLSHKEKYENAVRKAVVLSKALKNLNAPKAMDMSGPTSHRRLIVAAVFKEMSPFTLHNAMFIPTIVGLGSEEQQKYWLKKVDSIIGTYAQTELGHGTFLRGLETTATYDPSTEEFVIHSPTLSAYKWWPGGLGHTANYCILMAQLYTKEKNYGVHPFVVQLRDEKTHMPLPGIKIGEIGAKLGYNTVNNGFLGFDHYRIPREWMLMKNSQVLKDGTYVAPVNSKLNYGTMVYVRVTLVHSAARNLARAVTIAVRYSAVRRQSKLRPDEPEPQVMDYLTQQHKLFIGIATSYTFFIMYNWLWERYSRFFKDLAQGNLDQLGEMHSLACCLKAIAGYDCAALVEISRMACGGHGYMMASNLPQIYGQTTVICTLEGENTVLLLQTARALVKAWHQSLRGGKLGVTMSYLSSRRSTANGSWSNSTEGIIGGFEQVAYRKVESCVASIGKYKKTGLSPEEAWNMSSVRLIAASEAHCRAVILRQLKNEVDKMAASFSAPLSKVMTQLVDLYAIYWCLQKLGDLLLYTSISEKDVEDLQCKYEAVLQLLRPNAIGLVDAFDFRDEVLSSTLGAYDGRVYERLMEEALKSPLNAEPVNQSFEKYLKPFMQGKL